MSFCITTSNVYDNQVPELLYELKTYNTFILLVDAAYDVTQWFEVSKTLKYNLLSDVNILKVKIIESFKDKSKYENALLYFLKFF
ncbi:hypothetical protein [Clostridium botulinum]|uniref:hypothetical protein n=1 Tax=Clostridium botulinum TaxID=1491 RepID=UPI0004D871B7|nr:hypothetical protein [Clostridium botulinum]KEH99944.1 hypothetical protein Z952_14555 [Clostridium botulinum C/D str. BKT75002]KEI05667.1 hypothetical protein Z954_14735 [Clostridium botulinum C/D str. BKT2873]